MANSALGWPQPYLPSNDLTGSPPDPTWSKADVIAAGKELAKLFSSDRQLASSYLGTVQSYYANMTQDLTATYAGIILPALGKAAATTFNANDFANIHRATWLFLLEGFACLVDKNPHGDWGNPPVGGVTRGEDDSFMPAEPEKAVRPRCFHNIPNARGYFAIGTDDMPDPAPVVR